MTGDDDDRDEGRPDEVPIAETLDEILASDDSGLCAGLLDVLALLPEVGAARWVLHKAGRLALVATPGGYGFHEQFASEVIDAALGEMVEAGLVTIDVAEFDDAADDDADVAGDESAGESHGFEGPEEADDAGDEDVDDPEDLDDYDLDDYDQDDTDPDDSAFDTVTVDPDAGKIIMARQVAAGTIAELGARVCGLLEEAARSRARIDYALLADGMTACWDSLRPYLGSADDELVKGLLTMRGWGLSLLGGYPNVSASKVIEFAEKLVADYERVLGPGHPDAWEARWHMACAYGRCGRHDEAIAAFARLREDKERVLPADDGEMLCARGDVALGYMDAGRYDEAIREYTQLLADYERVMGPSNDLTLNVRGDLGEAYLEVGRVAEGIELMEAASAGLEKFTFPDWPNITRLREKIDKARGQEAS